MEHPKVVQARWDQARHDLLNMLLEFHNQWNTAFAVSHNCGHARTPSIQKCGDHIEKALKNVDDLEDLFKRYKKTLREMRDIVQEMRETDQQSPAR